MADFDLMMLTGEWLSRTRLLQVFVRRGGGKVRKGAGESQRNEADQVESSIQVESAKTPQAACSGTQPTHSSLEHVLQKRGLSARLRDAICS